MEIRANKNFLSIRRIFIGLTILGALQSLLGLIQFVSHKSLGLYFLGESFLSPLNKDLARVFIDGGRLLRAYGLFPHPNILATFLVLSLLSVYFLYNKKFLFLFVATIFINWLGLILTFSRAGWIVGIMASALFLLINYNKDLLLIVFLTFVTLSLMFSWAIFPRVNFNYQDFSVQNRLSDYQFAWEKIKEKPWFGHGLTFAMGERPIHNLYLTIAVEIGLVGFSLFLIFLIYLFIGNWPASWRMEIGNLKIMLLALVLLGLFDHFLWTLRSGLIIFWLVSGLLLTSRVWRK
ncbi:MAG: O-antigen ligase family protein [Patescibacteria group bacterium]